MENEITKDAGNVKVGGMAKSEPHLSEEDAQLAEQNDQGAGNDEAETQVDETAAALALAQEELAQLQDRYLRLVAEVDNVKKRSAREKADAHKFGNERLIQDLLQVLDSFEKAIGGQQEADADPILAGFFMVQRQLQAVLAKEGLEAVSALGSTFDPNLHQAIQRTESSEVTSDQVSQEFAKGYLLNGRLLRPAIVSVAIPKSQSAPCSATAASDKPDT
jgi:molecular chaperone GrpE